MGRRKEEDVMTQLDKMTQVHRTPTIPMTKRESVSSATQRVPLLSNTSSHSDTTKTWDNKDYLNTNPNMVAGKKRSPRTPKKVKRRDSYKFALNRDSVYSTLDENTRTIVDGTSSTRIPTSGLTRAEDRKKYNTLPRTVPDVETITTVKKVHKHENNTLKVNKEFDRNASTRSGTCPSPDTDTDQQSVMTDRKKKSAFKRMKERLILTFKRDRDREKTDKHKKEKKIKNASRAQVNPNSRTPTKKGAFGTPSDSIEVDDDADKTNFKVANGSRSPFSASDKRNGHDDGSSSDKKSGLFRSFRESIRRKSLKRSKSKGPADQHWSMQQTSHSSQSHSSSSMERGASSLNGGALYHNGTHSKSTVKSAQKQTELRIKTQADMDEFEDTFVDTGDSITGLFESLIDPSTASASRSSRPDTSKLRLNGLRKCRPHSPASTHHHHILHKEFFSERLSSVVECDGVHEETVLCSTRVDSIEIDGIDEADGVTEFEQEGELEFADVSQAEQQRRIDDVARCLAAIGDNIANKRESESAGSSMEDSPERTEFELNLLKDLREFGDEIDGAIFGPESKVKFSILPVVVNILKAQNYKGFQTVIKQELRDTVGWEQVAWYTYLMKSAVYIASTGKIVGSLVKRHATQYFSSNLQPWIRNRPNGWESIHEETDIESELD